MACSQRINFRLRNLYSTFVEMLENGKDTVILFQNCVEQPFSYCVTVKLASFCIHSLSNASEIDQFLHANIFTMTK